MIVYPANIVKSRDSVRVLTGTASFDWTLSGGGGRMTLTVASVVSGYDR